MRRALIAVSAVGLMLVAAPSSAFGFDCSRTLDDFNRPDSTNMGSAWTEQANDMQIENSAATNLLANEALMTFNSATANQACVDIASGGAQTQYVAIVLGYASVNHNLFVKVQDNNADGSFDRAYFEDGNNGADFATDVGLTPFAQARIHLALVGTDMTLDIDTNFDNHPDQSFTVSGVPTAGFGTAIGLGDYGHASADNFATAAIPPSPAPPGPTGQRAAALKSCKKRAQKHHWSHKRLKKCKKNANLLPI